MFSPWICDWQGAGLTPRPDMKQPLGEPRVNTRENAVAMNGIGTHAPLRHAERTRPLPLPGRLIVLGSTDAARIIGNRQALFVRFRTILSRM